MDKNKEEIVDGMKLWLQARQVEAIRNDDKKQYQVLSILLADVTSSAAGNEYPWELLMRNFNDKAEGKVK